MPGPPPSLGDAPDVPMLRASVAEMIAQAVASGAVKHPDMTGLSKEDIQIPTRDGASIRATLIKPTSGPPGPLAVLYHGGGWCIGFPEMEQASQIYLAKKHGAVSVSVDYRMAPEIEFPVAMEDSIDAMNWVRHLHSSALVCNANAECSVRQMLRNLVPTRAKDSLSVELQLAEISVLSCHWRLVIRNSRLL